MFECKFATYSKEFEEEAIRFYLEDGKGYGQLTVDLGIKDKKTRPHRLHTLISAAAVRLFCCFEKRLRGMVKRRNEVRLLLKKGI